MTIQDDELLNKLGREKYFLIKQFDRQEIDEDTYNEKISNIEKQMKERTEVLLEEDFKNIKSEQNSENYNTEENKMADKPQTEVKEEKVKKGRAVSEDSIASHIEKALLMKTVKDFDDVAAKVTEWKEGTNPDKVKALAKVIVKEVQKGKQNRWKKYNWDEEKFMLVLKETD